MLKALLGNSTREKVLLSLAVRTTVYPRELARLFGVHLLSIQRQLKQLEEGGIVVSHLWGRTRVYSFNPRYAFLPELKALLQRTLHFIPPREAETYYRPRLRPRRAGKPR